MVDWGRWNLYQQAMSPWQWGIVVVGIVASIWLIFWLRSYFREDSENADGTLEMLSQFRELHQEGGLSDDEFRLIRSRLTRVAQGAMAAGQKNSDDKSAELTKSNSTGLPKSDSVDSLAAHATEEKTEQSERISDIKTE